jgi:hypothetical protein
MALKSLNQLSREHQCEDCIATKKVVVENVSREDIDVYSRIQTGIATCQAQRTAGLPDDVSEEDRKVFFNINFDKEQSFRQAESEWWQSMLKKYKISSNTKIDTIQETFYVCLTPSGEELIDFEKKPANKAKKISA